MTSTVYIKGCAALLKWNCFFVETFRTRLLGFKQENHGWYGSSFINPSDKQNTSTWLTLLDVFGWLTIWQSLVIPQHSTQLQVGLRTLEPRLVHCWLAILKLLQWSKTPRSSTPFQAPRFRMQPKDFAKGNGQTCGKRRDRIKWKKIYAI